jgi:hypothetical protein
MDVHLRTTNKHDLSADDLLLEKGFSTFGLHSLGGVIDG